MVKTMHFELRRISRMKSFLPLDSIKTVVSALILSRLDYCNSLLAGLPDTIVTKLQRVQNCAARLILGKSQFDDTKEMFRTLHWLPVRARIEYKIALVCFNVFESTAPCYIQDLLPPYMPPRQLRSKDSKLLATPKTKLKRFGDRSLAKFGPTVWNSLPQSVRFSSNVAVFKKRLKTYLFTKYLL